MASGGRPADGEPKVGRGASGEDALAAGAAGPIQRDGIPAEPLSNEFAVAEPLRADLNAASAQPTDPVLPEILPSALYHVSNQPAITVFRPRPAAGSSTGPSAGPKDGERVVWAIAERLLHNYLLPRECPRVTFYAGPASTPEDARRLLGVCSARHVVAVESGWLAAIRRAQLYLYQLPPVSFDCVDSGAGYSVSRQADVPLSVTPIDDLLAALVARDVELRVMPSLWPLRDAVLASTLQYSFIRMRNASPRLPNR